MITKVSLDHFGAALAAMFAQLHNPVGDKRLRKSAFNHLRAIAKTSGTIPKEHDVIGMGTYVDTAGQISYFIEHNDPNDRRQLVEIDRHGEPA